MKIGIRKMLFVCITFLTFFSFNFKVNANTITNNNVVITSNIKSELNRNISVMDCTSYLGSPDNVDHPAYWLQKILDIMKYVAIIALLVLVILDFIKATVNNDKDALIKAGSTSMKRFIYCVLLFFVPTIVKLVLELFGIYSNCGIG